MKRNIISFLLPALYLGGVLFFDRMAPIATVTPTFCSVALLFMALAIRPGWIIWWASVYSLVVITILVNSDYFTLLSNGEHPRELISHIVRATGFVVTATFCCIFSGLLSKVKRQREERSELLMKTPVPLILSDSEGRIILANDRALALLGLPAEAKPIEKSFFELLAPKVDPANCIDTYKKLFYQEFRGTEKLELECRGTPMIGLSSLLRLRPPQVITLISRNESIR